MTQNNQQELGKTLWNIANNLRGAMMDKTKIVKKSPHF